MNPSLTERVRCYVRNCDPAVEGQHGDCQTLAVANALIWDFALSPAEALPILREYNARCSPPWQEGELVRKLQSAAKQPHRRARGNKLTPGVGSRPCAVDFSGLKAAPAKPQKCPPETTLAAVERYLDGFRASEMDVMEASPIRPAENFQGDATLLVAALFQPGEGVNFVTDWTRNERGKVNPKGYGVTVERDRLLGLWRQTPPAGSEAGGWLRMNPMDGKGVGDANVTAFRFALLEFDDLPLDLQLSFVAKLALPVTAILTSGGRSIHTWLRVDAPSVDEYRAITHKLASCLWRFGACQGNKSLSRLSRLPGVVRKLGAGEDNRQRVLYLNPSPGRKAIL